MIRFAHPCAAVVAGLTLTASLGLAQDQVPPTVPDDSGNVVARDREVDPTTFDDFGVWLAARAPAVPGVEEGGFLVREVLEMTLRARSGDEIGPVTDIALDHEAQARFFLVRLNDDTVRAVPVASVIVRDDDALFTELTPAQVEELPQIGG
jgi:hypothetical protein